MYFNKFPKIYYAFPNRDQSDFELQILTDITTNVRFRKEIFDNITLYDEYDIAEGETPEIIAEKVYGNPELHWVIMLLNEKYDYLNDFPISENELNNFIDEKYGENRRQVHHYEKNGIVVEPIVALKLRPNTPIEFFDDVQIGDVLVGSTSKSIGIILEKDFNNKTLFLQLDNIPFVPTEIVTLNGMRLNREIDEYVYSSLNAAFVSSASDAMTYTNDEIQIITNEMYEITLNESKRRIKLISPELLNQLLTEFDSLL